MRNPLKYPMKDPIKFIIIAVLFMVLLTYNHELAHKAIMKNHGCLDVKIGVSLQPAPRAYTRCLQYSQLRTDTEKLQEAALHNWNEIIGYPLSVFLMLIIFIYFGKQEEGEIKNE